MEACTSSARECESGAQGKEDVLSGSECTSAARECESGVQRKKDVVSRQSTPPLQRKAGRRERRMWSLDQSAPPLQGKAGRRERRVCFLDQSVLDMSRVHKQLCSCAFPTQTSLALCFQTNRLQHLAAGCSCLLNEGEFNL